MSHTEATPCKLPLLDGDKTTDSRLLTTDTEFEYAERFQSLGNRDIASFNHLLCTAWGLLLRCFTGQDEISFHFRHKVTNDAISDAAVSQTFQSMFQMEFDEHDNLATCYAKAKDGYAGNEGKHTSSVSPAPDSPSLSATGQQNTYVWVRDAGDDAQDVAVDKVISIIGLTSNGKV